MDMHNLTREHADRKTKFISGGGSEAIEKQHKRGKLTARERLDLLLDKNSFNEVDLFANQHCTDFELAGVQAPADAIVTGFGTIEGRLAYVYSQDFTVLGGSCGQQHLEKIIKSIDYALRMRIPLICINDSGGGRPYEGHHVLKGYGTIFRKHVITSGVVPQITLVMGPVGGGPCYGPALTDFIFMVKGTSHMFIGGPAVVKAAIGEDVSEEELGGARMHARISGVADLALENDEICLKKCRELFTFLPLNNLEKAPTKVTSDKPDRTCDILADIVPTDMNKSYDMLKVIAEIVDEHYFFELKPDYAQSMITGFARLDGHAIGILANQPKLLGGAIDINASDKATRFVRFCDAFNIPIVHLVDTPGYVPGTHMERVGIIRHGAKLLYAEAEATVPKIQVVIRKGYAGAYIAMGSKFIAAADFVYAWPCAEIALFGVNEGMSIILRSSKLQEKIRNSPNPELEKQKLYDFYRQKQINLYEVAPVFHTEDIINPGDTRKVLIRSLKICQNKTVEIPWKKHGLMPM